MLFPFPDRWTAYFVVHEYEPVGVADTRQTSGAEGGGWCWWVGVGVGGGGVDGVRVFPPNSLALPELAMPSRPRHPQLHAAMQLKGIPIPILSALLVCGRASMQWLGLPYVLHLVRSVFFFLGFALIVPESVLCDSHTMDGIPHRTNEQGRSV